MEDFQVEFTHFVKKKLFNILNLPVEHNFSYWADWCVQWLDRCVWNGKSVRIFYSTSNPITFKKSNIYFPTLQLIIYVDIFSQQFHANLFKIKFFDNLNFKFFYFENRNPSREKIHLILNYVLFLIPIKN